ncbi:nitrate reductase cytochrome c-type subunit [Rhodobacter capsulatus]|uniref:nitrate reductase cytochrome c-type subunit n=1 Tax=Rhodobacter capsulatus TaxID=1061 RepID=UPI00402A1F57
MKKVILFSALLAAAGAAPLGFATAQSAPATAPVLSLRGADPDSAVSVNPVYHQQEGRKDRNYRLQPPIIPHTIDKYQIDLHANECLACHDWKNAAERRAPTLSMTHYTTRDGVQTDAIAPRRWFCNQCHVPQVDAPALVDNLFKGSDE